LWQIFGYSRLNTLVEIAGTARMSDILKKKDYEPLPAEGGNSLVKIGSMGPQLDGEGRSFERGLSTRNMGN